MTSTEPVTAREATLIMWRTWHGIPRLLWFVVRPLCTVAAVAGCVAGWAGGASALISLGAMALVVLFRPTRRPWLALVVAACVFPVSLPAAAAVVLRSAVGVMAMIAEAGTWRDGLDIVARGRSALFALGSREEIEVRLRRTVGSADDGFDRLEAVADVWLANWARADAVAIGATTWMLAKGMLFGRWPWPVVLAMETKLLRLYIAETVIDNAARVAGVLVVAAVLPVSGLTVTGTSFGWTVPAWVSLVPAAWIASTAARRLAFTTFPVTASVLCAVAGLVLYGTDFLRIAGCGIAIGLPLRLAASVLQTRLLGAKVMSPRLPFGLGNGAVRDIWASARIAIAEGRPEVASRLWRKLTGDEFPRAVNAAAFAALAHVDLATGSVQVAVANARRARDLVGEAKRVRPQVAAMEGRVLFAAGDTAAATIALQEAVDAGQHRRDPQVAAAMAQVLALHEDDENALRLLSESFGGMLRSGNMREMIDSELAVVALIARRTPAKDVEQRLQQLLSFDMEMIDGVDERQSAQLRASIGRIHLLLGRTQLGMEKYGTAQHNFRIAINLLSEASDGFDQAVARIFLGVALNRANKFQGLRELMTGVRDLEALRGQLATGSHRSQLVVRHDDVYDQAFGTLDRLQDNVSDVAEHAFELAESLKRTALAAMLRQPSVELSDEVRELKQRIAEAEERGEVPSDSHHRELADALSDSFAAAYLPEPVDVKALRATLRGVHCVIYHMHEVTPERATGHLVWLPPAGAGAVRRIDITDPEVLALLSTEDDKARHRVMASLQSEHRTRVWQEAANALLPAELRIEMTAAVLPLNLVIVPGAELSALPWAALRLHDGRTALEAAVIQLTPTLGMLTRPGPRASGGEVLTYLDRAITTRPAAEVLPDVPHRISDSRGSVLSGLRNRTAAGVYVATHGFDRGLAQHIAFHDGSSLSAATALEEPWPPWVVFQSCFVGEVRVQTGDDPLGLPVSCLLGGAEGVIGGVIQINMEAAAELCPAVVRGVVAGEHPATALRDAQLAYLEATPPLLRTPARWAGLVCLSRTIAPF